MVWSIDLDQAVDKSPLHRCMSRRQCVQTHHMTNKCTLIAWWGYNEVMNKGYYRIRCWLILWWGWSALASGKGLYIGPLLVTNTAILRCTKPVLRLLPARVTVLTLFIMPWRQDVYNLSQRPSLAIPYEQEMKQNTSCSPMQFIRLCRRAAPFLARPCRPSYLTSSKPVSNEIEAFPESWL